MSARSSTERRDWRDDALVVNPLAAVLELEAGPIEVYAPQRGKALSPSFVRSESEPELHAALAATFRAKAVAVREIVPALLPEHRERLRELGLLVRKERAPSWPLFQCAAPGSGRRAALPAGARELLRNRSHFVEGNAFGLTDPVTGLVFPYWRRPRQRSKATPAAAPARISSIRRHWLTHLAACRAHLAESGYAAIRGGIPRRQLAALSRYLRSLLDNGLVGRSEGTRWAKHNDAVTRVFHHLLTPLVRGVVSEPIKPSYPYFAAYPRGSSLEWHTDREQCEYTVSLLVGYEPGGQGELAWPIYLEPPCAPRRRVGLRQRPGDMLIFKGREIPHARPRLTSASRTLHVFFHFVPAAYDGPLD